MHEVLDHLFHGQLDLGIDVGIGDISTRNPAVRHILEVIVKSTLRIVRSQGLHHDTTSTVDIRIVTCREHEGRHMNLLHQRLNVSVVGILLKMNSRMDDGSSFDVVGECCDGLEGTPAPPAKSDNRDACDALGVEERNEGSHLGLDQVISNTANPC